MNRLIRVILFNNVMQSTSQLNNDDIVLMLCCGAKMFVFFYRLVIDFFLFMIRFVLVVRLKAQDGLCSPTR